MTAACTARVRMFRAYSPKYSQLSPGKASVSESGTAGLSDSHLDIVYLVWIFSVCLEIKIKSRLSLIENVCKIIVLIQSTYKLFSGTCSNSILLFVGYSSYANNLLRQINQCYSMLAKFCNYSCTFLIKMQIHWRFITTM